LDSIFPILKGSIESIMRIEKEMNLPGDGFLSNQNKQVDYALEYFKIKNGRIHTLINPPEFILNTEEAGEPSGD